MKVSIAMATYNGAIYLQAQLDSFVAQTRLPDELVVTDDCSTDDTLAILEAFAATAPFKVIYQRNDRTYGYGGNFNQAMLKTIGDLVFLSDQDDVWFPEKISKIIDIAIEDQHSLVIMNDAALTDAELNESGVTKLGQIASAGFKEAAFVMGCCAAVKRELLELCLPIPETYPGHDGWIVGIADAMGRKRIVGEVLQYYRRHENNESQFLANRTSRVTLLKAGLFYLRKGALGRPSSSEGRNNGKSLSQPIVLEWARAAAKRAPEPYATEIAQFSVHLESYCEGEKHRRSIQQLKLPRRAVEALVFWFKGGYKQFTGAKSMVKDIVAPSV